MHALYIYICAYIVCIIISMCVRTCVRVCVCVCGSGQEDGRLHGFDLHLKTNRTARPVSSSTKQDINFQPTPEQYVTLPQQGARLTHLHPLFLDELAKIPVQ